MKFFYTLLLFLSCGISIAQKLPTENDSLTSVELNNDSSIFNLDEQKIKLEKEQFELLLADSLKKIELRLKAEKLNKKDSIQKKAIAVTFDSIVKVELQRNIDAKKQFDSLRLTNIGVPVLLDLDTLFNIYCKLGPYSPSERSKNITKKLERIAQRDDFDKGLFNIYNGESTDDLMYEDIIILSISDKDAFWNNKTKAEVLVEIKKRITNKVIALQKSNSIWYSIQRIFYLFLIIIGFFFAIKYMNKGFTALNIKLVQKSSNIFNGFKIKNYELLSPERQENVIRYTLKGIKWFLIGLTVYITLPIALSIFPSTEGIANSLFGYILKPLKTFGTGLIGFIPNLFSIAVIIFICRLLIKFLKFIAIEIKSKRLVLNGFYPEWAKPTLNLFKIIIYAMTFVMIFPYLPGSDSNVFKGVSVFLGVLFSLGSSSAIGNVVAGLVITYMRAFKVGDRVKIGDVTGDVLEKNLLVTKLKTIKNEEITIPNSSILNGSTTNYTSKAKEHGIILHTTITIGYDVSWKQVHELLIASTKDIQYVDSKKEPFVLQTSLDDFYVSYQINIYTQYPQFATKIYSNLHANIQDRFNEAELEIMSPHYRANRDGNMKAVPEENLPKDYKDPAFKIKKEE